MTKPYGMIIVSHSQDVAKGIVDILQEVASDLSITYAGGSDVGGIGTNFEAIEKAIKANDSNDLLAFYDLGSAKMNLEMVKDLVDKEITIYDTPILEGAYAAAALLQVDVPRETVNKELEKIRMK